MPKLKTVFVCAECGHETIKWVGRCPTCRAYNTFEESAAEEKKPSQVKKNADYSALRLSEIADDPAGRRTPTGVSELDRVLNGGLIAGSITLIGGDPGIGKSTLLLQVSERIGASGKKILYVSGEESALQLKLRAERLGAVTDNLFVMNETDIAAIEAAVINIAPDILIIDSIQTMCHDGLSSGPGSVAQVRECTTVFTRIGKRAGISVVIVGHVTKEGSIAGPKILEHMVDTVLYFEGERHLNYRMVRSVKNRFGPANEIGVFEMRERGLAEILNPSEYMLSGRPLDASGSVVTSSLEGTRPILNEVQALVCRTSFGMPRRSATGIDYNRVVMLMAVLEKKAGLSLGSYDGYVNIAGGIKITEPSADAAVVAAVAGSYKNKAADPFTVVFGEVGLTGEIRAVAQAEKRTAEASKLGFKQCVIPQANLRLINQIKKNTHNDGMRIFGVSNISELLEVALN